MVALDAATGAVRWDRPVDTVKGNVVYYLLHADDTLIIGLSYKKYHLYAYDAKTGDAKWSTEHAWTGKDHSGHMQHPVIVGKTVYLEPHGYDLESGKETGEKMGLHEGCATYAATENGLLYRGPGRCMSMWDADTQKTSSWIRLRPGCWLSTVAGGGMVLSPEGGGGCSCGGWMETSLTFIPKD